MGSYVYRRELTRDEMLPALGIGLGLGLGVALVTTYVAQILLRRTPLRREDELAIREPALRHSREGGNPGLALDLRHSREGGNPGGARGILGSRFRGNDQREDHGDRSWR